MPWEKEEDGHVEGMRDLSIMLVQRHGLLSVCETLAQIGAN